MPSATGSHIDGPPGVMILRGANVSQLGRALPLSTSDLAPTVLALLGVSIPTNMDGRVVQEALPAGFLQSFPLSYAGTMDTGGVRPESADLAAAEALVSERLSLLRGGAVK